MMGTSHVIHLILNKLKARYAHAVETHMVGAASLAQGGGVRAQIGERRQPGIKYRFHRHIVFGIDATDFAGPIIEIEVSGNLSMLRLYLQWPARFTQKYRQAFFSRICAFRARGHPLLHIGT